jgi:hypothetical protein
VVRQHDVGNGVGDGALRQVLKQEVIALFSSSNWFLEAGLRRPCD